MTRPHKLEDFKRKQKPLTYHGNGTTIEIACTLTSQYGQSEFELEVAHHNCRASHTDLSVAYKAICEQLDLATAIDWKPFLEVEVEYGTRPRFGNDQNDDSFLVNTSISISRLELAKNHKGESVVRQGDYIHSYTPNVGIDRRGHTLNGLPLTCITAVVPDTEENRAAFKLLAAEFDKLHQQLHEQLQPRNIQNALTAAVTRGLLTDGTAPRKKTRKRSR